MNKPIHYIPVTINGSQYNVEENQTILETCKKLGIYIPRLCYHPDIPPFGQCGLCIVEIDDNGTGYACIQKVAPNMNISTNSETVMELARSNFYNFMDMSVYPHSKDIEDLFNYFAPFTEVHERQDDKNISMTFNSSLCIGCDRCVRMCVDIQGIDALVEKNPRFSENQCISCGQCIAVCPTSAITHTPSYQHVLKNLANKDKIVVLQIAPAVRVSVGDLFDEPPGTVVTGKIIDAAKQLGFNYVFDTCFAADVTTIEEGNEFLERLNNHGTFPMFTSCCPAWINYIEKSHPDLVANISTTKSPHIIEGVLIKNYFAKVKGIKKQNIFVVSLMPCVAKKMEIKRMQLAGDVDAVIIPQELADMMKMFEINWNQLKNKEFDSIVGHSSGGGQIFGASGGVTEAVVRYTYEKLTNETLKDTLKFSIFRGNESLKKAEVKINDVTLKLAVCNGIKAAKHLIETNGHTDFHLIEVMSCKGGCVNGGGQPKKRHNRQTTHLVKRTENIFGIDEKMDIKTPKLNPEVIQLYEDYLKKPGSHMLHTHYEHQETTFLANLRNERTKHHMLLSEMRMVSISHSNAGSMLQMGKNAFTNTTLNLSSTSLVSNLSDLGKHKVRKLVEAFTNGFKFPINTTSIDQILEEKTAFFVINSSEANESFDLAISFYDLLENSFDDLTGVRYAVCEFTNKKAKNKFRIGREIDILMEHHLASRITPYREVDISSSDFGEPNFERWYMVLCYILGVEPPKLEISVLFKMARSKDKSIIKYPLRPNTFTIASLKEISKLDENLTKIVINVSKGTTYEPGDYLQFLPKNPPELVEKVLASLNFTGDEVYKVKSADHSSFIPEIISTRQLLEQYLDLCTPPTREMIKIFAECANEEGQALLEELNENGNNEDDNKDNVYHTAAQFCETYSKYGIPELPKLLTCCPKIKPRTFSILKHENQQMTVIMQKHVFYTQDDDKQNSTEKKEHEGLCSSYFSSLINNYFNNTEKPKDKVAFKVAPGILRYPKSNKTPVIMIAYNLGASSCLALLHHRTDSTFGDAIVFYEHTNSAGFQELEKEFHNLHEKGTITNLFIINSTENTSNYNSILENSKDVWRLWKDDSTVVFFSGNRKSESEETKIINEAFVKTTIKEGGLRDEEAMAYTSRHQFTIEIIK
ncbi:Iron only hydrogenase large subunit, C-terminal domain containing protein [Tritrichomonas foetus]|uniref:Iron only hydrogenase large subunit, C-terminal domain containing protein n=1 Tax=Tritrichomonas foetus TaxID=1144522 RepID=A0A1J4JAS3_9EUKA|nr:Iron only hydrogenase large subunit, C-terminal domain containing protein [Tritrichomonas foetus]|eukprot:OHS94533.1 Iron only hydrogenase large subunit, C-terminal domain containing protein [Tritrichomonas foetus]